MGIHPAILRRKKRGSLYNVLGNEPALVSDMVRDTHRSGGVRQDFDDIFTTDRTSEATQTNSAGVVVWGPHNLALNSATPATQSITVVSGADYTVECTGSGSITLSGAGTGTVTEGNPVEVTASTTSLTLTVAGDVDLMWCYRSDLGGMAPVPVDARVSGIDTYVPTTSTAKYLPRRHHHVYSGGAWVDAGTLVETEARTQLLHTTDALVTQSVTTTAEAHTLHFTGTGTVTLSGTSTAGPLVGTGTGEENRVSLTFTPTAGTLTLTVSGTVTDAQLEVGSIPSSYIPNLAASGTVPRAADTGGLTIDSSVIGAALGGSMPDGVSISIKGRISYADTGVVEEAVFTRWYFGPGHYLVNRLRTLGALTGTIQTIHMYSGVADFVEGSDDYSPGVNVPFNIASRHNSGALNNASNGLAATEDNTPAGISDLSATDLVVAYDFMGCIEEVRVWSVDIGDAGIAEATA